MNFKTTGLLLVLVVIVGAAYFLYPKGGPTEAPPKPADVPESDKALLDPAPAVDEVVKLTLQRPGQPYLVFVRSPKSAPAGEYEDWQIAEPFAAPADTWAVRGMVGTLIGLRSRTRFEPGSKGAPSDADAGLAEPVAVALMSDKDGKEYRIEIGRVAAMSNETYVRVTGRPTIHLVARDLGPEFKKTLGDFRERALTKRSVNDATRVELTVDGQPVVLTRGDEKAWVIDVPVKAYAKTEEVQSLLRKVIGLRVQEFLDDAPTALATFGLEPPQLTLKVTFEYKVQLPAEGGTETQPAEPRYETKTETLALSVGGVADLKKEKRYAKLEGQPSVFSLRDADITGLKPDLVKLRDPAITRVKATDATRLELVADGQMATLEKVDGVWRGSGDLAELESAAVMDVLEGFEDLSAIEYIEQPGEPATYGLDRPRAVLTVTAGGLVAPVTVHVGSLTKSGRNAYVQRDGQTTVYVVSAAQANRLVVPPLSLRSRAVFSADPGAIRELDITRGPQRHILVRTDAGWRMTEPADAPVDSEAVRVLVNDLSRLRAKRVAGRAEEARFGLENPAITLRFVVEQAPPAQPAATEPPPVTDQPIAPAQPPAGTSPADADPPPATQPADHQAPEAASLAPAVPPATHPTGELTPEPVGQSAAPPAAPVRNEHVLRVGVLGVVGYAQLDDGPYVFELDETVYRVFNAELINRKLFDFKAEDIAGVTIVAPGGELPLAKEGDEWKFTPDPFVKLSQQKVKGFIDELAGLRVDLYLEYRNADLAAAGLLGAPLTVSIRLRNGDLANLKIEPERPGGLPRVAGWVEQKRTFRLRAGDPEKLLRGLDYYAAADVPAQTPSEEDAPPPGVPWEP